MHDDPHKQLLEAIREQVQQLENRLQEMQSWTWPQSATSPSATKFQLTEQKVRALLNMRRRREQELGTDLFADPAWDILLEALAASLGQRRISVSDLCNASPVPMTTALRWLQKLERDAWVHRRPDLLDGRRHWIELTERASTKLRAFLQDALPSAIAVFSEPS